MESGMGSESMTLIEALKEFGPVEPHPDYPEQPGIVHHCGIPVVMRRGTLIECSVCGRSVRQVRPGYWEQSQ